MNHQGNNNSKENSLKGTEGYRSYENNGKFKPNNIGDCLGPEWLGVMHPSNQWLGCLNPDWCLPILSLNQLDQQSSLSQNENSLPRRRRAPTHQNPMKIFSQTLRVIFLKEFKKRLGNQFIDIPELKQLQDKYLTKSLMQKLFDQKTLCPIIREMFETRYFYKAFRLSKVQHPKTLAKFYRQIPGLQESFQQRKVESINALVTHQNQ